MYKIHDEFVNFGETLINMKWHTDTELFEIIRAELYTAVIGDIMDKMGLLHQFLPAAIQPLRKDMFVVEEQCLF